jgi:hypothetical protein
MPSRGGVVAVALEEVGSVVDGEERCTNRKRKHITDSRCVVRGERPENYPFKEIFDLKRKERLVFSVV